MQTVYCGYFDPAESGTQQHASLFSLHRRQIIQLFVSMHSVGVYDLIQQKNICILISLTEQSTSLLLLSLGRL